MLVARIWVVDLIEANTVGPSRGEDGLMKAMKGKAREVRAREEGAVTDEEWALCRRMVSEVVVRKKIEIEMMIGELAGLERLLEE
jgi:hypothetical protein